MENHDFRASNKIRWFIFSLLGIILLLIVFQAGEFVGYRKAHFGSGFGDNFSRSFGDKKFTIAGHGVVGQIVSINLPQIVVAGPDNLEKTVVVNSDTLIRQFQDQIDATNLKVGDHILVLGMPQDTGQIDAKLIRVISETNSLPTN